MSEIFRWYDKIWHKQLCLPSNVGSRIMQGFSAKPSDAKENRYYLFNHIQFHISYHQVRRPSVDGVHAASYGVLSYLR
jgi:hypothetical protein